MLNCQVMNAGAQVPEGDGSARANIGRIAAVDGDRDLASSVVCHPEASAVHGRWSPKGVLTMGEADTG